jgi:hypothetical protein
MAWFTSYNDDPDQHVVDGVEYEVLSSFLLTGTRYTKEIYTVSERYIGMTETAAIDDAAVIKAANPTWNVSALPENNGGGWSIKIIRQVIGDWIAVS